METLNRRVPFVLIAMGIVAAILIGQLVSFQFRLNPSITEFEQSTLNRTAILQQIRATRGEIYDRDGVVLAVNSFQYRVGISPSLVLNRRNAATQLATILNLNEAELYDRLQPNESGLFEPYILLPGLIDDLTARTLEDLRIGGLIIEPVALRTYPQGELTAQLVGFVNLSEQGFYGVEGRYDRQLAGNSREVEAVSSPFNIDELPEARDGQSLMLTLDRDVQFVVKEVLFDAIEQQGARGGTIVVMDPRTGEILGMYSCPSSAENECPASTQPQNEEEAAALNAAYNPAVSAQFEPGSILKVITAAITLEAHEPGLDIYWSYNNTGCFDRAGVTICDHTRNPKGTRTFVQCIVESLNTCTATWYIEVGPSHVYPLLQQFGFGASTGIDLEGEADGTLRLPGSSGWSEADFLNVSYGQAIATTPIQMLNAVNAIANGGLVMQPHIVKARMDGNQVFNFTPNPIARPISAETASLVTDLMIQTVSGATLDASAALPGYSLAGKTGTAQKPTPGGYSASESWASFVGFLPADNPRVSAIIILDRPRDYWGSVAVAPHFRTLMERLVVIMEIPPDAVRHQLEQAGGDPFARN